MYFQLLTWLTSQFRRFLNEQNLRMLLFWCWVDWRSSSDGFSSRCKRPHSRVGSFKADSHTCLLVAESRHKRRFAESVHAGRHFIHIGEIFGMLSKSRSVFKITFLNYRGSLPYADFGTWKKPRCANFTLVGLMRKSPTCAYISQKTW